MATSLLGDKHARLRESISSLASALVAFSGGVDSGESPAKARRAFPPVAGVNARASAGVGR